MTDPDATSPRELKRLEAAHLAELAPELERVFDGFVLVDLDPKPPRDVLLVFAQGLDDEGVPTGGIRRLRVSASREAARIHVRHRRDAKHRGPEGPFYAALREALIDTEAPTHLAGVHALPGERALALVFADAGGEVRGALGAEFFGPAANLFLLAPRDPESAPPESGASQSESSQAEGSERQGSEGTGFETEAFTIVQTLATPTGRNAERLAPGEPWTLPTGGKAPEPEHPLAAYADVAGPPPPRRFPLEAPLSWIVERLIAVRAEARAEDQDRARVIGRIERKLDRARRQLDGLEERRRAAEESERVRQDGELLQAHLGQLKRGLTEVTLDDWTTGEPRTIQLDPARSPKQNMEQLFSRYKKLQRALAGMGEEEDRATQRLADLQALLDAANDMERAPDEVDRQGVAAGLLDPEQTQRAEPKQRLPYRTFRATSGAEIRVGRSARDNDTLSTRHCRGNDVWLHTADSPGSHVVLCLAGAPEPHPEDLLDAATLALHYSPQRGARKADIHVARGKEVHKPRGAKPGLVTLSGGSTLYLRFEPERLRAITARSKD